MFTPSAKFNHVKVTSLQFCMMSDVILFHQDLGYLGEGGEWGAKDAINGIPVYPHEIDEIVSMTRKPKSGFRAVDARKVMSAYAHQ